jgi:tetratricopeptide (TPR) repeat protein
MTDKSEKLIEIERLKKESPTSTLLVYAYRSYGSELTTSRQYENAKKIYNKGIKLMQKIDKKSFILARLYYKYANCCFELKDYTTARTFYKKAVFLLEEVEPQDTFLEHYYSKYIKCLKITNRPKKAKT